uniref:(northern house mosquito) hypothetical protein n=1 Tax=Culex pipiens TaxID=7175 RepID=A0A8D8E494_CULPI
MLFNFLSALEPIQFSGYGTFDQRCLLWLDRRVNNRLASRFFGFFEIKLERLFGDSLNDFDHLGSYLFVECRSAFDLLQRLEREPVLFQHLLAERLKVVRRFFCARVLRALVANVIERKVRPFVEGRSRDDIAAALANVELGRRLFFVAGFKINRAALGSAGSCGQVFGRDRFLPLVGAARFRVLLDRVFRLVERLDDAGPRLGVRAGRDAGAGLRHRKRLLTAGQLAQFAGGGFLRGFDRGDRFGGG